MYPCTGCQQGGTLDEKNEVLQDVQGLSQLNKQLLNQRGAMGEPSHQLRETFKKVGTMVSVVSKRKTLHERVEDLVSTVSGSVERAEQHIEQAKDSQLRDIVAAHVRETGDRAIPAELELSRRSTIM